MSEQDRFVPGVPSWVDLTTPEPAAAQDFYGALFGWSFADAGPAPAGGRYVTAGLDGGADRGRERLRGEVRQRERLRLGFGQPVVRQGDPALVDQVRAVEFAQVYLRGKLRHAALGRPVGGP